MSTHLHKTKTARVLQIMIIKCAQIPLLLWLSRIRHQRIGFVQKPRNPISVYTKHELFMSP